jgi:hypothetical protein
MHPQSSRRSFSVGTVLLLTAVVAIGMAGMRVVVETVRNTSSESPESRQYGYGFYVRSSPSPRRTLEEELRWRALGGTMVGLLVGIGVGVMRPRPVLGGILGGLLGMVIGAAVGGAMTCPDSLAVTLIGSLLLFLMGAVICMLSNRPDS